MLRQAVGEIVLTDEQVAAYRADGYLSIGQVADAETIEQISEAEEAIREHPRHGGGSAGKEGTTESFRQLNHLIPALRELALFGPQVPALTQLIGPNVAFVFSKITLKHRARAETPPKTVPWHQDNAYTPVDPPTNIAMFVALDDMDETNGCLWVIPGSHLGGLRLHGRSEDAPSDIELITPVEDEGGIPLPMKRGDALLMSGLTLHRSLENWTDRPRRLLLLSYTDAAARSADDDNRPFWTFSHSCLVAGAVGLDDTDAVRPLREGRRGASYVV